jgi:hypothetical protein
MVSRRSSEEMSLVSAARSVPFVAGDTPAMRERAEQLVARARAEGVDLAGDDGLLTAMVSQVLQTGLEVELADHLGYGPHDSAGRGSGNSRNGTSRKTVTTDVGDVELRVPRDRNGTFETQTVPKHQRRLDGLTGKRDLVVCEGHDDRRHPSPFVGDLRNRHFAGDDLEDHRRDRRGHARVAAPSARPALGSSDVSARRGRPTSDHGGRN